MSVTHTRLANIPLTEDPSWLITEEGYTPLREREIESIMTIGNGYLGTRGSLEEGSTFSNPGVYIAGVYDTLANHDDLCALVVAPNWLWMTISIDGEPLSIEMGEVLHHQRTLDMKQGLLVREWRHQDDAGRITNIRTWRFSSITDPHLQAQRLEITTENYTGKVQVRFGLDPCYQPEKQQPYLEVIEKKSLEEGGILLVTRTSQSTITLAMASNSQWNRELSFTPSNDQTPLRYADSDDLGRIWEAWEWETQPGTIQGFDRMVTIYTSRDSEQTTYSPTQGPNTQGYYSERDLTDIVQTAQSHLRWCTAESFQAILDYHLQSWQQRWFYSEIRIEGDEASEQALHFSMYHLIIAAAPWNERVSIGARSLSGSIYEGHIFWDTEIFILPFFIYTWPEAARALLMYRYHTLPAARRNAKEGGHRGAHFAWESTITGEEMTPPFVRLPDGQIVMIYSGEMEDHIVADVAYAVWHYWLATGDQDFLARFGSELIVECARFWASRATGPDDNGLYHINRVIGPDEYHENVEDNAFTNFMARWNLEIAVETVHWLQENAPDQWKYLKEAIQFSLDEVREWEQIAAKLYIDYDPETCLLEQYKGFFQLAPVDVSESLKARIPPDVLWGRKVVQSSQVVKQADVLMLFFLFRNQFTHDQLLANFKYYEPITAHGSSLSPAIHALLSARAGDMEKAMEYFKETAHIDLANHMGNASGGVHVAAMGGLWQAAIHGFAGVQLTEGKLNVTPLLPKQWKSIAFRVCWHSQWVWFKVLGDHQDMENPSGIPVKVEVEIEGSAPVPVAIADHPPQDLQAKQRYYATCDQQGQWSSWRLALPPETLKALKVTGIEKAGRK